MGVRTTVYAHAQFNVFQPDVLVAPSKSKISAAWLSARWAPEIKSGLFVAPYASKIKNIWTTYTL